MMQYLFVVSCDNPARYDLVQRRLAGKDGVEVILDRRFRERRRRDEPPPTERRRAERRRHDVETTLRELGWVWVQQPAV